jgi:benzoyl-CoA 2,3-dioxygenase component A
MNALVKQHLIDPEVCIRCNTCEATCPIGAITHDANNYVVDPNTCNFCMDCVSPCPTGSIDHWFVVPEPFSLEDQFSWLELPPKPPEPALDPDDSEAAALLDGAHAATGGRVPPPPSAAKPQINVFNRDAPARATVTGNLRLTVGETDTRHIILDFGSRVFPVLEGQSIGVIPPGTDAAGKPHAMRLYSIASARDGERPNTNNLALTVKRTAGGLASNWLCDMELGATLDVIGPFGATFLLPAAEDADILMICTGTGAAPFRGFTEYRRRHAPGTHGRLHLYFGARTPEELPYFGPLQKLPATLLQQELVYSRLPGRQREYVQDRMRARAEHITALLRRPNLHVFICGLRGLEAGVEAAFTDIAEAAGMDWATLRESLRTSGRLHVETY